MQVLTTTPRPLPHRYVTPKSFLELLALYSSMLSAKRVEVGTACKRLEGGVVKLREANASVAQMKVELSELHPILELLGPRACKCSPRRPVHFPTGRALRAAADPRAKVSRDQPAAGPGAVGDGQGESSKGAGREGGRSRCAHVRRGACKCSPRRPLTLPQRWSEWRRTPKTTPSGMQVLTTTHPYTSPQVERMAQDAQADLDKALPAFESAVKSLKSLSKSDLVEVKGYAWHLMASDGI